MSFGEFCDKKTRTARKHLKLIERILRRSGFEVKDHSEEQEPYLFLPTPAKKLSFGGIRIYQWGESVAYRVQKEEKTHPYGRAYRLDIKEMYDDLMSEEAMNEKKAANEVIDTIPKELKRFFEKSFDAERELRSIEFDQNDPLGRVVVQNNSNDYTNMLHDKTM
jgi:hypothetical protein